jgi:hypothetical protein
MGMSSWEFIYLLKEIINELMGILRFIYLKKSLLSYTNGLLGFPAFSYLKKMLSVCGRREAHLLTESCDFLCK